MACHILTWLRVDAELFVQLADKRLGLRLTGFYFSACEFPHARLVGMSRALGQ